MCYPVVYADERPKKRRRLALSRKKIKDLGMKRTEFSITRAACAYFFLCPGLAYGVFTSRLPALKMQTGADESQIGLLLLCVGMSSLVALFCSSRLIALWEAGIFSNTAP